MTDNIEKFQKALKQYLNNLCPSNSNRNFLTEHFLEFLEIPDERIEEILNIQDIEMRDQNISGLL